MKQDYRIIEDYTPPQIILRKYAELLVNYALNSGKGIKKGDVVYVVVPDVAKPLLHELELAVLRAGGQPLIRMIPTGFEKDYFETASIRQLEFFPQDYLFARADLIDHSIAIIADTDPFALKNADPKKLMAARNSKKPYVDKLVKKENDGKYTWTIGLYGTQANADEVGLSLEQYWEQIIKACFLDFDNPAEEWNRVNSLNKTVMNSLNSMEIDTLHFKGEDMDITHTIGEKRLWVGGSGRNIPSFEIFTSPDWRGTNGHIKFNQPLYRYGNVLKQVELEFKDGIVVEAHAEEGNEILQEMIKTENANKVGEISLTDKRTSRITHVMAETLFDENIGGPFGNTHLAIGRSYHDCFSGDPSKMTEKEWAELGYNDSIEHTDIISTTDREVVAKLKSGEEKLIYADGQFQV